MSWCPKCEIEYRDGFTTCSDCGTDLVDELQKNESVTDNDYEVFFMTASNSFEADSIAALLSEEGIPVLKKYKGAGGYLEIYMGTTIYGIDIYVPSRSLNKAREVLDSIIIEDTVDDGDIQEEEREDDLTDLERKYKNRVRIKSLIIVLFLAPGLLYIIWYIITTIIGLFQFIYF